MSEKHSGETDPAASAQGPPVSPPSIQRGAERLGMDICDAVDGVGARTYIETIAADPGVRALVEQLIAMEMAEDVPSRWKILSHYNLRKWEHGEGYARSETSQ